MVRNSELPSVGHTAKAVALFVKEQVEGQGYSQEEVGKIVGRTQSYASLRIKGLKPWSIDELDKLAKALGCGTAFVLIDMAHDQFGDGVPANDAWIAKELAAIQSEDGDKEARKNQIAQTESDAEDMIKSFSEGDQKTLGLAADIEKEKWLEARGGDGR